MEKLIIEGVKWYCRFLFWKKHGQWYQKRNYVSLEWLLKEKPQENFIWKNLKK